MNNKANLSIISNVVKNKMKQGKPECVNFFDLIEGVLPELDVVRGLPAALVLVGRDVGPEGLKVAQAVARHCDVGPLAFDQLKKDFNHYFQKCHSQVGVERSSPDYIE
jgi:hypothetical protein